MNSLSPLLRSYLVDTSWFIILIALWICFNADFWVDAETVRNRGWFRGDHSISLPISPIGGTFPTMPYLFGFSFVIPILLIIITWIAIDWPWSSRFNPDIEQSNETETITGTKLSKQHDFISCKTRLSQDLLDLQHNHLNDTNDPMDNYIHWAHYNRRGISTPLSRKIRFVIYQLYVFIIIAILTIIVTTALKLLVREFRPDFLARCQPDYSKASIDPTTNYVSGRLWDICTNKDATLLFGGTHSFPSGHSSSSLAASTFMAILLYKRAWNRGQRLVGFVVVPTVMMIFVGMGLLIAVSRSWDNRHHPQDIIIGCILGVLCGLLSLLWQNVFTPSWELDGSAVIQESPVLLDSSITSSQNGHQTPHNGPDIALNTELSTMIELTPNTHENSESVV